jgi:death on curing protein
MIYLSLEQIIELHDALIKKFNGLIGIRDRGLLESALAFLRANGKSVKYDVDEFLEFVVSVAEGKADLAAISNYFAKICF